MTLQTNSLANRLRKPSVSVTQDCHSRVWGARSVDWSTPSYQVPSWKLVWSTSRMEKTVAKGQHHIKQLECQRSRVRPTRQRIDEHPSQLHTTTRPLFNDHLFLSLLFVLFFFFLVNKELIGATSTSRVFFRSLSCKDKHCCG